MKRCPSCKRDLPLDEFSLKNKLRGWRNSWCRQCHKEYHDNHYRQNKDAYKATARAHNIAYRAATQSALAKYFATHPCVDCGETDIRVLHFDHVRGSKVRGISVMVRRKESWGAILTEIGKCDVRCANCHMRRTSIERGWWTALSATSSTG